MTILPTHTCFDDALDWLAERVKEGRRDLVLVHGIQVSNTTRDGDVRFAHAWVEDGGLCWDFGTIKETGARIVYAVPRENYYAERRVELFTRYSTMEAAEQNCRTGHYGPWRPEYRALCGRGVRLGTIEATVGISK